MSANEQALLFRVGGLGDLIVALPAISLVRRSLPRFSLTLVGRPEYGALLKRAGLVDEVLSFDDVRVAEVFRGPHRAATGAADEPEPAAGWLDEYSLALGWLNRDRDWPRGDWWARRGMARAFFTCFEQSAVAPMSRFFFDRTGDFLNTPADRCFDEFARLTLPSGLRKKALTDLGLRELKRGEKRLVVHPGSGGRAKRWPLTGFLEVIRGAGSLGVPGVLVTGQAESDLEATLDGHQLPDGWSKVARLPAETLAGLLSESTHYLGNDSGPTHLAAACGASVLALFRADNVPAWRPFGKTRVLAAPAVEAIAIQSVLSALQDLLAGKEPHSY
jgi:heptosyltransferase III